ncbi:MAG: hypothetical protein ABIP30_07840 [Ferruginibacter sp.]
MNKKKTISSNCEKATLLIEKKQIVPLTLMDNLYVKIHLAGCEVCRTYQKQSTVINYMTRKILKQTPTLLELDEDFKRNMQFKIDELLNKK